MFSDRSRFSTRHSRDIAYVSEGMLRAAPPFRRLLTPETVDARKIMTYIDIVWKGADAGRTMTHVPVQRRPGLRAPRIVSQYESSVVSNVYKRPP